MLNIKTTVILTVFACLGFSSIAAGQDNVPVPVPEFLKNVPFKIEGVDGFLQSLGIDPKAEPKKFSKKELRNLAEANYNDKTAQHFRVFMLKMASAVSPATIRLRSKVPLGWPTSVILR